MIAMAEKEKSLKYSKANTKLKRLYDVPELEDCFLEKRKVYSLDLLSGHSCPFAKDCLSKVYETGEISAAGNPRVELKDGPDTEYRCFSASQEGLYPTTYALRKHNMDLIKKCKDSQEILELLEKNFPKNCGILRWHVGGDFLNQKYFNSAIEVAKNHPSVLFYAYTKSLPYWIAYLEEVGNMPENFILTASRGGRNDNLIEEYDFREAVVVLSEKEAEDMGLEIDHDDSHACRPDLSDQNFALLIHGIQPKGSAASKAIREMKKNGTEFAYSSK